MSDVTELFQKLSVHVPIEVVGDMANFCAVLKASDQLTGPVVVGGLAANMLASAAAAVTQSSEGGTIYRADAKVILPLVIDALRLSITLFEEAQNRLELDG